MPILIKIASFLAPVLLNFLNTRGGDYIDKVFKKVGHIFNKTIDTTLVFVDEDGNPKHPSRIDFYAKEFGLVGKNVERDGSVILTGFEDGDKVNVYIYDNDKCTEREIEINDVEVKRLVLS